MHTHNFIFTYEGDAVCEYPGCRYRFTLRQVKNILWDIANDGKEVQQSIDRAAKGYVNPHVVGTKGTGVEG